MEPDDDENHRTVTHSRGWSGDLLDGESMSKTPHETPRVIEAISGGDALPPEPTDEHHEHNHGKPSDRTVVVVALLYIGGGAFLIWLGARALYATQQRRKTK